MKLSIVTINLNKREGLLRTLESLTRQTDRDFELIVVDGGSTDGSLDVCRQYENLIDRLIVEKDDGIYDAWNKGVRAATGDLIGLLNSGDEYHPKVVATVGSAARQLQPDEPPTIFCGNTFMVENGTLLKPVGNTVRHNVLFGIGVSHPAMIVQRRVYEVVGAYERISIASDSQFILRSIRAGIRFVPVPYRVFMEAGGISQRAAVTGFSQYVDSLRALKFCGAPAALALKSGYRLYKFLGRRPVLAGAKYVLANARHLAILLMHLLLKIVVGGPPRRWLFRLFGFSIHDSTFVSPGALLYRTGNLHIGAGSVINRGVTLDNRDVIRIGRGCSISHGAALITAGHDIDSPYFEYQSRPIRIEDHVVIFARAIILPGTVLDCGVVVLAGSVISGTTIPGGIYGGVPAKLIRQRASTPRHLLNYQRPFAT
jgi:glycosyltransferase involved in cell wall biosynthesis/carbonic anhydrase/acetyltransferase-like protein (isoleucine patch superfamily)